MLYPASQPFCLLLYLEWVLLVTAAIMEILLPFNLSWLLLLQILIIVAFALMRLKIPRNKIEDKIIYTGLEFSLILLAGTQGGISSRAIFILCLVIVMRSCLIFKHLGQWTVLILSFFCYGSLLLSKPIITSKLKATVWDWRLSSLLLFSLTLVFAVLLINALLAEQLSREELEKAHHELAMTNEQLRHYALRIEDQATLQERNRIAREIHDGLGHTLAAQTIQINNALMFWGANEDKALIFLKQAKQLGAEALLEIRRSVSVLRSNPVAGQFLESALSKLLMDFQQTTGIILNSEIHLPLPLPVELNTTLYRIVQESLTNIYKHSGAQVVMIELKQDSGMVHLYIEDDGQGFNPTQNTTGFGIQGMRERALTLGGQFHLHSQSGIGCRISVSFPFPHSGL